MRPITHFNPMHTERSPNRNQTAHTHTARYTEDFFRMEAYLDVRTNQITSASSNSKSLIGHDLDFLIGRTAGELLLLLPAEDQPSVVAIVKEAKKFLEGLPYGSILSARLTLLVKYRMEDAQLKWLRLAIRPLANEFGMIGSYRIDVHDISDETGHYQNVHGSIAYVNAFGEQAYYKFQRKASVHEELNNRELKILGYLAQGLTSKEIADRMNLSKDTIDKCRKQMLLKTGTRNTVELVMRAMAP